MPTPRPTSASSLSLVVADSANAPTAWVNDQVCSGKLMPVVTVRPLTLFWISWVESTRDRVSHVVLRGAEVQVSGVYARRVVAAMQDERLPRRLSVDLHRRAMRVLTSPESVSISVALACPYPALALGGLVDIAPEVTEAGLRWRSLLMGRVVEPVAIVLGAHATGDSVRSLTSHDGTRTIGHVDSNQSATPRGRANGRRGPSFHYRRSIHILRRRSATPPGQSWPSPPGQSVSCGSPSISGRRVQHQQSRECLPHLPQ